MECSSEVKANFHYFILLKRVQSRSSCLQGVLFFSSFPFISISSCISGAASPALAHCLERRVLYSAVLCCRGSGRDRLLAVLSFWGYLLFPRSQLGYENATFAHTYSAKHQAFQHDVTHCLKQLPYSPEQESQSLYAAVLYSKLFLH